jgi:hypothetical protein
VKVKAGLGAGNTSPNFSRGNKQVVVRKRERPRIAVHLFVMFLRLLTRYALATETNPYMTNMITGTALSH